jgi:hypothetical protein
MATRPRRYIAFRIVRTGSAGVVAIALLAALGGCAGGDAPGYGYGRQSQYGGAAPDLNCQFGSPCGNYHASGP